MAGQDSAPAPITHIGVAADQGWQKSSVTLQQGRRFRIDYISGQWTYWQGTIPPWESTAAATAAPAPCCEPLPQAHKGALIGKIGQEVFLIGHGGSFTAGAKRATAPPHQRL